MALVVGVDTYGTLTEADAYFARKPHPPAQWTSGTSADKENSLWMGAMHLDSLFDYPGLPVLDTQALGMPRTGFYLPSGRVLAANEYPTGLKYAQFELAAQWLVADQLTPDPGAVTASEANGGQQIKEKRLGPLITQFYENKNYMFDLIDGRLRQKAYPLVDMYMRQLGLTRKSNINTTLVV